MWQELLKLALDEFGAELFEEHTVGGFLWGYKIDLVQKINDFAHFKLIKNDTFGLFYGVRKSTLFNQRILKICMSGCFLICFVK